MWINIVLGSVGLFALEAFAIPMFDYLTGKYSMNSWHLPYQVKWVLIQKNIFYLTRFFPQQRCFELIQNVHNSHRLPYDTHHPLYYGLTLAQHLWACLVCVSMFVVMLGMVGGLSWFSVDFVHDILSEYKKIDEIALLYIGVINTGQRLKMKQCLYETIEFHIRVLRSGFFKWH